MYMEGDRLMYISAKDDADDLMKLSSLFDVPANMINEIVYKACAIREALLGVSCHSYIFSLNEDTTNYLHRVAGNMGITYVNRDYITNPDELTLPFMQISMLANNEPVTIKK